MLTRPNQRSSIVSLMLCLALVAILFVYRSQLWIFIYGEGYAEEIVLSNDIRVSVGHWKSSVRIPDKQHRRIKISFPFTVAPQGCEFVYGAVVQDLEGAHPLTKTRLIEQPRYLIRFAYDLKNGRCEAKDLALLEADFPATFHVQLVDVVREKAQTREVPRREGVLLKLPFADLKGMTAQYVEIEPVPPFRQVAITEENAEFSLSLAAHQYKEYIAPYDDPKTLILSEIEKTIHNCEKNRNCQPIRGAVADIMDADIIARLAHAQQKGVPVDIITNYRDQSEQAKVARIERGVLQESTQPFSGPSPWMWLRRNPHRLALMLPMHAKFLIFGDDTVISSNANFSFMFNSRSREITMRYQSKEIVKLYDELLMFIRTLVFRPLSVDLKKSFVLLFNADRPRQYVAGFVKPYVSITSQEDVRSNAYGILLAMLEATKGQVTLVMSPLSNVCDSYERRRCLYRLIEQRASQGAIDILLNAHFFIPRQMLSQPDFQLTGVTHESELEPSYHALRALFPETQPPLQVLIQKSEGYSLHHERLALFGNDLNVVGSTNFGSKSTLNLLEVVRDSALNQRFRKELDTADEPYIVTRAHHWTHSDMKYSECEFTFERDVRQARSYKLKRYSRVALAEEFKRQTQYALPSDAVFIVPKRIPPDEEPTPSIMKIGVEKKSISDVVESYASYFCVEDPATDRSTVIRTYAADAS